MTKALVDSRHQVMERMVEEAEAKGGERDHRDALRHVGDGRRTGPRSAPTGLPFACARRTLAACRAKACAATRGPRRCRRRRSRRARASSGRPLVAETATRTSSSRPSRRGSRRDRSCRRRRRARVAARARRAGAARPCPCRASIGGQHLEHLASEACDAAFCAGRSATRSSVGTAAARRLACRGSGMRRQPLGLRPARRRRGGEVVDPSPPASACRIQLEPVRAGVDDPVDADPSRTSSPSPAGHDGDERVTADEPLELRTRLVGGHGVLRPLHDRREHAVEVEEERRLPRARCREAGPAGPSLVG